LLNKFKFFIITCNAAYATGRIRPSNYYEADRFEKVTGFREYCQIFSKKVLKVRELRFQIAQTGKAQLWIRPMSIKCPHIRKKS